MDYQRLFLDHLDLIDQIARITGRRRHVSPAEREDFAAFVRLRMIENDYAILRKFQGRSSLRTYLATVVNRLSLDYCIARWGRWRPSAAADRLGPVAVLLECLVTRDGQTAEEAIAIVRTNHGCTESEDQLRDLWDQLPARVKFTEVSEEAAAARSSEQTSASLVSDVELQQSIDQLGRMLQAGLASLSDLDRVLLGLRFDQDLSVVQIGLLTGNSTATVHRRLERAVKRLKRIITESGMGRHEISGLLGHPSIALPPLLRAEVERFLGPVRLTRRDG